MKQDNEIYTASFKRVRIIKNLGVPIGFTHPLFAKDDIYYIKGLYYSRLKGKLWPKQVNNFLLGPYKNKKECALGLIKELSDKKLELLPGSLERLLQICGLNIFGNYPKDLDEYYSPALITQNKEGLDLGARLQDHEGK